MAYEFEFLQCDVWIKLFLYLKTSIASNKMCADSEKSCFYDHIGRASAVIKMQASSEVELTTPGLQDQWSSHWAMEAYTNLTAFLW